MNPLTCYEQVIVLVRRNSVQAAYSILRMIGIVSATGLVIKMHGEILYAVCTELLLTMNIYLFETYQRIN